MGSGDTLLHIMGRVLTIPYCIVICHEKDSTLPPELQSVNCSTEFTGAKNKARSNKQEGCHNDYVVDPPPVLIVSHNGHWSRYVASR
jgi:hypothetical protein